MKDQKDTSETWTPEYVQTLWITILDSQPKLRYLTFSRVYKGQTKEDIKYSSNCWNDLTYEEKVFWVSKHIGEHTSMNEFADLINVLKYQKNPKKALEIWKLKNNL